MDNKTKNTFYIKTNFWTQARVIIPIDAATAEEAADIFRKGAEEMFGVSIRDLEIEEISANLEVFADVLEDPESAATVADNKKLH